MLHEPDWILDQERDIAETFLLKEVSVTGLKLKCKMPSVTVKKNLQEKYIAS